MVLDAGDTRIEDLRAQIAALDERLTAAAGRITALRAAAATELAGLVAGELVALAMPRSRLVFELTPSAEPGPNGADQVNLLFSANPGSTPGPLGKVASGGELSRVRAGSRSGPRHGGQRRDVRLR